MRKERGRVDLLLFKAQQNVEQIPFSARMPAQIMHDDVNIANTKPCNKYDADNYKRPT